MPCTVLNILSVIINSNKKQPNNVPREQREEKKCTKRRKSMNSYLLGKGDYVFGSVG